MRYLQLFFLRKPITVFFLMLPTPKYAYNAFVEPPFCLARNCWQAC